MVHIPRGIHFYGETNDHLLVHNLQTSEMSVHSWHASRDGLTLHRISYRVADNQVEWKKQLQGGM